MKLLLEQVDVGCRGKEPYIICWRGGAYDISRVLDTWSSRGPWWGKDECREYLLIETTCGIMEIFRSDLQGWMLSRLFD